MDFLEIEINAQKYLLASDNIKELTHYQEPQPVAGSSKLIDGIISHKNKVIPIISVRKLLGFKDFQDTQIELFDNLERRLTNWVDEYEKSLRTATAFKKTLDPHMCAFGEWIDKTLKCLKCNTHGYVDILKNEVRGHHNALHENGAKLLQNATMSLDEKMEIINANKKDTLHGLGLLKENIYKLTLALEQVIIYEVDGIEIGLIVDNIEKNHSLDEKNYNTSTRNLSPNSPYIQFIEHYEIDKQLMFSIRFTEELQKLVQNFKQKASL